MLMHTDGVILTGLVCAVSLSLDNTTVENLRAVCLDHAKLGENSLSPSLDSRFFGPSPSQVLYLIEVSVTVPCLVIHCVPFYLYTLHYQICIMYAAVH